MSRRDAHFDAMLRNLGATYYQTTKGTARAADVTRALESVAAEDERLNGSSAVHVGHGRQTGRWRVVDPSGKLIGIVGRRDLLSVFLRSDEELAAEVRNTLATIMLDEGETVTVSSQHGVVALAGALASPDRIRLAVRLASDIDGVVSVRSKISVTAAA